VLLDPRAAALNKNDQHDHKQNAGDNPNNRDTVHFDFPFFDHRASFPSLIRTSARPGRLRKLSAKPVQLHGAAGILAQAVLLDPRAAALDQYDEHDDKQNAGNNPNDRDTVHFDSSFLSALCRKLP
jgi:hypothetical protein